MTSIFSKLALVFYTEEDINRLNATCDKEGIDLYTLCSSYGNATYFDETTKQTVFTDLNGNEHEDINMVVFPAEKQPSPFAAAYADEKELIAEFRKLVANDDILKTAMPDNFDYKAHIGIYTAAC